MPVTNWTLNEQEKTYTTPLYGGEVKLYRRQDTGKLFAEFTRTFPLPEGATEDAKPETLDLKVPLHDQERVAGAQEAVVERITEALGKLGYDFHKAPVIEDTGPDLI
jgi:hypothetical protein